MTSEFCTNQNRSENLFEVLRAAGAGRPDQPFLTAADGSSVSYSQIFARCGQFSSALAQRGVGPGDRVLVKIAKSADAVALYLGCLQRGAVYVPLNTTYTHDEVRFFVEDATPALSVFDPGQAPELDSPTDTMGTAGSGSLAALADTQPALTEVTDRGGSDMACMLYTSGTTGRSKGAMLTHRGLISNARSLTELWGFTTDDVLIHSLPVFHVHGLFVALHCTMLSGSEAIFLPRFDVDAIIEALPRASVLMGVPTHYVRLLADPRFEAELTKTVRLFTSGSAPMTEAVHAAFFERTGQRILERYGMTEAGIITSNPLEGQRIPGTVGMALPGYELRVATDEGECAPGETGVVEIRGEHLFAGYWQLPDKTAEEHRPDDFFITGDVGSLDETGRLTLEGRSGDMIISGGENIYPKEIELCLDETDGVAESAVVGLPHPSFGEAVTAFIVVDGDFDEDRARATLGEHLARFKHPKKYIVVAELPRNAMGKVQKGVLRSSRAEIYANE